MLTLAPVAPRTFAAALALLLLGSAPKAHADVIINEFEQTGTGTDRIEVYNTRPDTTFNLSGWVLENELGTTFPLSGLLPPNDYATFVTSSLVSEGGVIELYDGSLLLRDDVQFGDMGGAPLPPIGFTTSRAPDAMDTGDNALDWNLDATATFSAPNDNPPSNLGATPVKLNEAGKSGILRRDGSCPPLFVELVNEDGLPVNLTNWLLTDGRQVHQILGGIPAFDFKVETDFPPGFCFLETGVLYLLDPFGARVDQLGFAGMPLPPGPFDSYQRLPDGAGPYDGFDFLSSGGWSTLFVVPRTIGATNQPDTNAPTGDIEDLPFSEVKDRYR